MRANALRSVLRFANGDSLIFESDCLFFSILSVSFSRIVLFWRAIYRARDNVDDYTRFWGVCQPLFSLFSKKVLEMRI